MNQTIDAPIPLASKEERRTRKVTELVTQLRGFQNLCLESRGIDLQEFLGKRLENTMVAAPCRTAHGEGPTWKILRRGTRKDTLRDMHHRR